MAVLDGVTVCVPPGHAGVEASETRREDPRARRDGPGTIRDAARKPPRPADRRSLPQPHLRGISVKHRLTNTIIAFVSTVGTMYLSYLVFVNT